MTKSTGKNKRVMHKVDERRISPDDIMIQLRERDRLAAADTRDAAARWLGDPPPHRSALAQRSGLPDESSKLRTAVTLPTLPMERFSRLANLGRSKGR